MMMTGLVTCDDDDDDDDDEWLCQRWSVAWETRWWKAIGDLLKFVIVFISKNQNHIHWLNYVSIFPLKCHMCHMSTWHCQVTSSLQVKLFAWYSMYIVQFTVYTEQYILGDEN